MVLPMAFINTTSLSTAVVLTYPCGTRVVQQNSKSIRLLLDFGTECLNTGLVLQIRDNVIALSRTKLVESGGSLFQLTLLSARNDHMCSILDKSLGSHLTQSSSATSDEDDMIADIEEVGDSQIGADR